VMNLLSPDWAIHRTLLLPAVGIWVMYSNQIALYQNWKLEQRRIASPWHAPLISHAGAVLQLGLDCLPLGQDDYLAYDLLMDENYTAAERVLKQSRTDDPDVRFNLALVYFDTARLQLARQELPRCSGSTRKTRKQWPFSPNWNPIRQTDWIRALILSKPRKCSFLFFQCLEDCLFHFQGKVGRG
jgi:hypothetical protein